MATQFTAKRKCLSFEIKQQIIDEVEKGQKSKADICREYNLSSSTLSTFLKNKDKIREAVEQGSQKQKRHRTSEFGDVEKGLLMWFKEARLKEAVVCGATLKEKGKEIAEKLGHQEFTMSDGRIGRFKRRYGITFKSVSGESASAKDIDTSTWNEMLKEILEFQPCNIYNANETCLYYKCLPDKALALYGGTCSSMTVPKDRVSILCAVNMEGTDKLPLLTIGKFAKPRCLKNIHTFPVTYRYNKKALMTSVLFEEWVRKLDEQFFLAGRSVALVVDSCSAHPHLSDLHAIKLFFLPPNTTWALQPCDQGIIRTFKALYRKRLLQRYINEFDLTGNTEWHYKMTLLDAMVMAAAAWNDVEQSTVQKCFTHAGFMKHNEIKSEESSIITPESSSSQQNEENSASQLQDMKELGNLFERMRNFMTVEFDVSQYVDIDQSAETTEGISIDSIVSSVQPLASTATEGITDDNDDEPELPTVSVASALQGLEQVRSYLMQQRNTHDILRQVTALESAVQNAATQAMTQTTISDIFKTEREWEKE